MDKKKIEKIDQYLKGKNIDPVLRTDLEKKKEILSKDKTVKK
ncbi:hypothetical protein V2E39_21105 [Chryseobacterium arthrosphaerae]|uniref:Uncharacterized protein n=1 Tax=Chryseobacterium arthrosphaerae TaxID=651561 RepID=A0ABU7R5A1_9FLAO|nr:hypothetical protein [Dysgonomonas mossii]